METLFYNLLCSFITFLCYSMIFLIKATLESLLKTINKLKTPLKVRYFCGTWIFNLKILLANSYNLFQNIEIYTGFYKSP